MFGIVAAGVLCLALLSQEEGRIVHLSGRNFSFQVLEPEGWELDTRAAPQIANFIYHPRGVDWREAEAVVYVRLIPRSAEESQEEFITQNRSRFEERCPFADQDEGNSPLSVDRFAIQVYDCPGVRKEILAITSIPGYFAVFALSLQSEEAEESSLESFEKIVTSFRWFTKGTPEERRRLKTTPEAGPPFEPNY